MIPAIVGGVFIVAIGFEYLALGAAAGTGYGLGRKYGRKVCETVDNIKIPIPQFHKDD